jgi:hypothetical protein
MRFGMKLRKLSEMTVPEKSSRTISAAFYWLIATLTMLSLGGLVWSMWPIPRQVFTVSLPEIYWSSIRKETMQFPAERLLTLEYPTYLRLGDIHEINAYLKIGDPIATSKGQGCDEFCTLKHPPAEDIWLNYHINTHFAYDLSNLWIEPQGETILPLSPMLNQTFTWQFKAVQGQPAYLKHTVFLDYIEKKGSQHDLVLVYAKELDLKVVSIGNISMPILRVICIVLILSAAGWFTMAWLSGRKEIS